jgi:hypothetical protein
VDEGVAETDALGGETVGVGRADDGVAVAAEAIGAVLVVGEDEEIPAGIGSARGDGE